MQSLCQGRKGRRGLPGRCWPEGLRTIRAAMPGPIMTRKRLYAGAAELT
eukprot:CAMPEP_0197934992 /NCGR_PEP_ID=MMETSP1439-20131203/112658_1 /TAXON_ID=66791 /ORGANISM="Gonyaulax spinifera, Strain CCMP409" /LENGTH=48 /DNA_ID= /DNA_START= /DNA_END= /DNA_ORIENTATION=